MDFDQLHTFLEIVRLKSFSRAAQTCFRTQPAISAQIRQMEQELGTALFERFGNRFSLTTAGKIFSEYAQQLLEIRGMTVTYGTLATPASMATGFQVMILSSGLGSDSAAAVFKDVPIPVIVFSNSLYQTMGFVATSSGRGSAADTLQNTITDIFPRLKPLSVKRSCAPSVGQPPIPSKAVIGSL